MSIVLEEKVNKKRAAYLLDTYTFEQFYTTWTGTKVDAKKQHAKIIKYLNTKIKDDNDFVKYNYVPKGRTDGRLFGEDSIQNVNRSIRGFLTEEYTTDIDIINCHPQLLMRICENQQIECSNLKQYCNERKQILQRLMADDNISYEDAKKKILVSTNSNKSINSNNEFLKNYDREIAKIQKRLLDVREYNYLKDIANKDANNFEGSFINHILCVHENEVLTLIQQWCVTNEIKIHSLMFDGLMVYGDINEVTLTTIEKHIHENSMFTNIKLAIKPHEHTFVIPDDYIAKVRLSYDEMKQQFEKENCKVGCQFVNEKHDTVDIYKRGDFVTLHEELIHFEDKEKDFITTWFKDGNKRRYDKFDSFPKASLCPSHVYNMWKPFPVEKHLPVESDEVKKALDWFLNHIKVLVDYDETCFDFVCLWIAQMFQYPEHKSVELFFISGEGAGKGCFLEFFKTIMGGSSRCWETTNPEEEVFGKFNGGMKEAFLVVFNEVNKSNFYNKNDSKKALITDDTININIKGVPQFTMKSYHRFIAFTNNFDPATKNRRRDVFFRSSDDKIGNTEYFNEGWGYAKDMNCCKYIYDFFMKLPTKVKITVHDLPKTEYDEILKEEQKSPVLLFLEDLVCEQQEEVEFYKTNVLYALYREYCNENSINTNMTKIAFSMKLSGSKFAGCVRHVKKIDGKTVNGYNVDKCVLKTELEKAN